MRIICTQENLKTGVGLVGKTTSNNTTLPILNNILLKTEGGMLKLATTNLEIGITTFIRCKIEEEGQTTVSCRTFTDIINTLPNKNINISTKNNEIQIETENHHTTIKTIPAEEFPLIPTLEKKEQLIIPGKELKKAIDQVIFATSSNQTQPEITGIHLAVENNCLNLAATDRYRLAEKKITLQKKQQTPQEAIIPHKTASEISRVINNEEGDVQVTLNSSQALFTFHNTQLISRLIEGQYPPYQQIIPTQFKTTIITEKQAFSEALKAVGIFSQSGNSVNIQYDQTKQKLVLSSESGGLGKNMVELTSKIEGESGGLVINYRYILECLSSINNERVVIRFIDNNSPALITPEEEGESGGYLYLVMPIKN